MHCFRFHACLSKRVWNFLKDGRRWIAPLIWADLKSKGMKRRDCGEHIAFAEPSQFPEQLCEEEGVLETAYGGHVC